MSATLHLEHLGQLSELNRAFLGFVQLRARDERDCLGLPTSALPALRDAADPLLDSVAQFPRALFRIGRDHLVDGGAEAGPIGQRHRDLTLSILLPVRQVCRQSPYQARLLFGLDGLQVQRLRALPLPQVQRLACAADVLQCAFSGKPWLWHTLLTDTRPESWRHLVLVALQPRLERDWPQRRPARPVV
jgi:hypothetical protein